MKKIISAVCLALLLGAGTSSAAENINESKPSIGYEGIFAGNTLQGLSSRYWFTKNIGGELNVFYGNAGVTVKEAGDKTLDADGDLLIASAKFLYAPVVKEHSRFYCGLEGGLGQIDADYNGDDLPGDITLYSISPLIGAEFNFAELPELGLNWEVGYKFHSLSADGVIKNTDVDIDLGGTFVTVGAHYYF